MTTAEWLKAHYIPARWQMLQPREVKEYADLVRQYAVEGNALAEEIWGDMHAWLVVRGYK